MGIFVHIRTLLCISLLQKFKTKTPPLFRTLACQMFVLPVNIFIQANGTCFIPKDKRHNHRIQRFRTSWNKKIDPLYACSERCSVNGFQAAWGRVPKSEVCRSETGQSRRKKKRRRNDRGEKQLRSFESRRACGPKAFANGSVPASTYKRILSRAFLPFKNDPHIISPKPDREPEFQLDYPRGPGRKICAVLQGHAEG